MSIKITINNREINNPIARFIISLLGLLIAILVSVVLFFLLLPLIWFVILTVLLVMLSLVIAAPKLVARYKIIVIERKTLNHSK